MVLTWANSPSADVVATYLIRRNPQTDSLDVLGIFAPQPPITTFTDTTAADNIRYAYGLVAIDDAHLHSDTTLIHLQKLFTGVRKPIAELRFSYDLEQRSIQLSWPIPFQKVKKYTLYRQSPQDAYMAVYKVFEGKYGNYIDKNIEPNLAYKYRLMAELEDSSETKLSNTFTAILADE